MDPFQALRRRLGRWFQQSGAMHRIAERQFDLERVGLKQEVIGQLTIYGDNEFVSKAVDAVLLLKERYPYGYSLVQRYIRAIVKSNIDPIMGVQIAVRYERGEFTPAYSSNAPRYAAYLVRCAVGQREATGFQIRPSSRALCTALRKEMTAMKLLGCSATEIQMISREMARLRQRPRI